MKPNGATIDLLAALALLLPAVSVFCIACGTDAEPEEDVATAAPEVSDSSEAPDVEADASVTPVPPDFAAAPFQVGVARSRMPVPLGIGTAGFGAIGGGGPKSPYAAGYPATNGIYTHPSFHAVAILGAPDTVVMVRVDTVGVTQEAREAVIQRVIERGGPDLSHGLVVAATHTHSGPGRLLDNDIWAAVTDAFFPQFYLRFVDGLADTVMAAIADAEPARYGWTEIVTDALHKDRRCENPEFTDGRMPILLFERADGSPKAVVATYAIHGTVIGASSLLLSRDIHGGIEMKIEEQFDAPVTALLFNSWSGDMSPRTHPVEKDHGVPGDFNGIEAAGNVAAALVIEALSGIETTDKAVFRAVMARIPLNREALGYEGETFPFEYGGVYCGAGTNEACWGEPAPDPNQVLSCIPFGKDFPAPPVTMVGMLQLGSLYMATLPGEPVTPLGVSFVDALEAQTGAEDVALLGYAQGYIGYSLSEEDWYQAGYEASGSLWGPKQGDYLVARATELARHVIDGYALPFESPPPIEVRSYSPDPQPVEPSTGALVAQQPNPGYASGELVEAVVHGGDPWLLAPIVTLERQAEDGSFGAVLRKNQTAVRSDGYEFSLHLAVDPSYDDVAGPVERTFAWTVRFPTVRGAATTTAPLTGGTYRLRVDGHTDPDTPYSLTTDPFTVD